MKRSLLLLPQLLSTSARREERNTLVLSSWEINMNVSIDIPRYMLPRPHVSFPRYNFSLSIPHQSSFICHFTPQRAPHPPHPAIKASHDRCYQRCPRRYVPCNSNEFRGNDVSPRLTFPSAYGGVNEETDEGIQNTTGRYCISDNENLTIQRAPSVKPAREMNFPPFLLRYVCI